MLVMAFQETDLSPEAFFYFTGTAREDAWTTAILAALGERVDRYEKVNLSDYG
jgi:inositol polyphosphate 5-phosphatase INPP5B/F